MTRYRLLLIGLAAVLLAAIVGVVLSRGDGELPVEAQGKTAQPAEPSESAGESEPLPAAKPAAALPAIPEADRNERTAVASGDCALSVLVLDQDGDAPLAGVPVQLSRGEPPAPVDGRSDANGRCRFDALRAGEYTLAPGADGDLDYHAEPFAIALVDGETRELVLRVERRWFLAGVVVEAASRAPVSGVGLMARSQSGKLSGLATSGDGGRFRSRKSFPAGGQTLFLSQGETEGLLRSRGDGPELLRVTVGTDDASNLIVELPWDGALRGVVSDLAGKPIQGAEVRVLGSDSIFLRSPGLRYWALYEGMGNSGRTARTDEQGRFQFGRLPDDRKLVLVAGAPGFVSGRSPDLAPPFLASDEPVELRLAKGGTIVGSVLDAEGEPMAEVTVSALSPDTDYQPDPTTSAEDGTYRLEGLKPGMTEVTAKVRGDQGLPHAVASGEALVVAGEEASLILRAGADGVHLSGVAVDQYGRVITRDRARLKLRATPLEPSPGERTWGHDTPLEADGSFHVTVAREGGYRLTLLQSVAGDRWESLEVQAPAQDLRLTCTLVLTSQLVVEVVDASSGAAIDQGNVAISWDRGTIGGNYRGGKHSTMICQGTYTLTVDAKGYAPASQELDLRGTLEPETKVEVRLDRGRQLSGVVLDAAGEAVHGSTVVLIVGGQLQLANLVYSDADGRFVIDSVPTSGASVCVIDESYRTLAKAEVGAGDVVLKLGGE